LKHVSILFAGWAICLLAQSIYAGSATWKIDPTNDWNNPRNWTPQTVPNSPDDTATFDLTNVVTPVIHSDIHLDTLLLTEDAPAPITITVGDSSSEAVA
jgi:hypothetical protein